jgi:hypothetical protein
MTDIEKFTTLFDELDISYNVVDHPNFSSIEITPDNKKILGQWGYKTIFNFDLDGLFTEIELNDY